MKVLLSVFALVFLSFVTFSPLHAEALKSVTLNIEGMTCRLCTPAVKKALSRVEGVKSVDVSFKKKEAHVEYEEGKASVEGMIKAVEEVGYRASLKEDNR